MDEKMESVYCSTALVDFGPKEQMKDLIKDFIRTDPNAKAEADHT
jgi:hypothetical protein